MAPVRGSYDAVASSAPSALDGIAVTAHLKGSGDRLVVTAQASNAGNTTYQVPGLCGDDRSVPSKADTAWSGLVSNGVGDSQFRAGGCATTRVRPWAPGERLQWSMAWNATQNSACWHGTCSASSGPYNWTVWLDLFLPGDPPQPAPVAVTFHVDVQPYMRL